MKLLGDLWSAVVALFGSDRTTIRARSVRLFRQLDIEELSRRLKLVEQAVLSGEHDLPASDSQAPDAPQLAVINYIDAEFAEQLREATSQMDACAYSASHLSFITGAERLRAAAATGRVHFQSLKSSLEGRLTSARDAWRDAQISLSIFRDKHHLSRPSQPPESRTLHIGVLLAVGTAEVLLNTTFFAVGNELGVAGGFGYALALAFVNVLMSFAIGRFSTYFIHVNVLFRVLAYLLVTGYIALILFGNLMAAHYRDAMQSPDPTEAAKAVVSAVLAHPFALSDFVSYIVFIVGISFVVVAFIDGVLFDDQYPGYGAVSRRLRQAKDDFNGDVQDSIDDATGVWLSVSGQIDKHLDRAAVAAAQYQGITGQVQYLTNGLRHHIEYLSSCLRTLLSIYHGANERARKSPAPAYFRNHSSIDKQRIAQVEVALERYQPLITPRASPVDALSSSLKEDKAMLKREYEAALSEIRRIAASCVVV